MPCTYEMHRLSLLAKHYSEIMKKRGISIKEIIDEQVRKNENSRS